MKRYIVFFVTLVFFILFSFFSTETASAHCDTIDGPVVAAARKALDTRNASYALIWVKPESENEIRKALKRMLARKKGAKTKEEKGKVDMEFFETLVRIHREGEGAKYEGIKPAGSIEPEVALADKCVESGNIEEILVNVAPGHSREIIRHLFDKVQKRANYDVNDITSGRKFIEAYVHFIHTVEAALKGQDISEKVHHH